MRVELQLLILCLPLQCLAPINQADEFIIWNVGQGLWTTWVQDSSCIHFDSGGERKPGISLSNKCSKKKNLVYISHADWDHINGVGWINRIYNGCVIYAGNGNLRKYAVQYLSKFKKCEIPHSEVMMAQTATEDRPSKYKGENYNSSAFYAPSIGIGIPGDAPAKNELKLTQNLPHRALRVWLLGHHGSNTSTSKLLLKRIRSTQHFVASARHEKYGHPHPQVKKRVYAITKRRVITTEAWGNLRFKIK